ncbi:Rqc2 family fibronectin-binding protein [Pseudostreptobacillus hongkongensis]|uniref:Rqc2 family fibronectin-binding protein n=1 Tax=Pseudostreptobacillus hongkongensis TaxID=1162717 RepID=UPI0008356D1A|nr:NFACT family protein [Pseudostreptobacillus hongkongensis]
MIYLDSIGIKFLTQELNDLNKFKVNKIFQYDNSSFSLFFSKKQLFFQIKDNESIVYIKEKKEENNSFSSNFLLSLRKYLDHAELINVETLNNDRIIQFTFNRVNISGNMDVTYIIFELMGRHSNIFLLNENRIILNVLNNNSSIDSKRFYSIGSEYESFKNEKNILNYTDVYTNASEMIEKINGIGNIFAQDTYNDIEKRKLLSLNYTPYIYLDNKSVYLTYNNFSKYANLEKYEFNNLNEAINSYFDNFKGVSLIRDKKKNIEKHIKNKIKKNEKTILKLKEDIEKDKNFDYYRYIGDLLASNLYLIKPRDKNIEVMDYATNKMINIDLDIKKSPSDNLKLYYTRYRKSKKGLEISNERLSNLYEEQIYLNETLDFLERENEFVGLEEIEKELNIYKNTKNNNKKNKNAKRELLKYVVDNFEIFVGRNSSENNYLTFEKAKNNDVWLHVRDIPGSHVIIQTNKKEVPDNVLLEAARLAARNSKGTHTKTIDYTERVNVKRTNKYGNVTFTNFKSLDVSEY